MLKKGNPCRRLISFTTESFIPFKETHLNHAEISIRNHLTNVMYHIIMNNFTKNQIPKTLQYRYLIVANIETHYKRFIRRHFGLRNVDNEMDI